MRGIFCVLLILAGCSATPDPDDYFPLNEGLSWDYQVTMTLPDHAETTRTLHIENQEETRLDGQPVSIRHTSDGTDYYVGRGASGIFRYAKRTLVEAQPRKDASLRMILPDPVPTTLGKTWTTSSTPYTIRRIHPYETMTGKGSPFNMVYELSGLDESITVPAGTFEHCLLVEGRVQLRLYTDARRGYSDIDITTQEWYAPGVGLVKLVRSEPLNTDVYKGGTLTLELEQFSQ